MNQQLISLQPQIIQFNSDSQQLVKIVNRTATKISNCFFCLFNTSKYQFNPQNFDLDPYEHKIIKVTMLNKNNSKPRQFAYVKSKQFSKRITLLNYDAQPSQTKFKSPNSDADDVYTLSSRDYRDSQKIAYDRIIAEKEAYIKRLQRKLQDQENSGRQNYSFTSDRKKQNAYIKQIDELQSKIKFINNQKLILQLENKKLTQQIKELPNNINNQTYVQQIKLLQQKVELKEQALQKMKSDFVFLEAQCESLFQIVSQKQSIIKNLNDKNDLIYQKQQKHEQIAQNLKAKLKQQIKKLQAQNKQSKMYIKNLQQKLAQVSKSQCQNQQKKMRNKIEPSGQHNKYIQIALESYKNENQILKKNIVQADKSLIEQLKNKQSFQSTIKLLQNQIHQLNQQVNQLRSEREEYSVRQKISRNESHEAIIKLRSQNIDLIQKMGFGQKKDRSISDQVGQLKNKLSQNEAKFKQEKTEKQKALQKVSQAEQTISKLTKKLSKYKNETKKQLQDLTLSTLDELKKTKLQKKQLRQKVAELSKTIQQQKQKYQTVINLGSELNHSYQNNQAATKYPASQSDRRVGIKNQRKCIQDSLSLTKNEILNQNLYLQLGQLRQFKNCIEIQMKKMKNQLNIQLKDQQTHFTFFTFFNIFETMRRKLNEQQAKQQRLSDAVKQIEYLKGRIYQFQNNKQYSFEGKNQQNFPIINAKKLNDQQAILKAVKEQMKAQYKKLTQSLKISQEKFELLKKKIYQQYRSKIYGIMNGKQESNRNQISVKISKIEQTLQKFVQNLGNRSHKQAIIGKQAESIQKLRKDNSILKQKINDLNNLLETKKGYCTRDALKLYPCINQPQWHDNIQLEAKMLTFQAQNIRLMEENKHMLLQNKSFEEQLKVCLSQLEIRQQQIFKLKKQVADIKRENQKEMLRRQKDIQQLQMNFIKQKGQQSNKNTSKDKQYSQMKQEIKRKKQIIQNLKQKERMLEQIIQSTNRSNQTNNSKNTKQLADEARHYEIVQQFKQNNRILRVENTKLKQEIVLLKQDIEKKNSAYRRIKVQTESSRVKSCKYEEIQVQKLSLEISQLKNELRQQKSEIKKISSKRQKQNLQFQSQIQRLKNQFMISKSSLESIIRSLSDSICRLYSDLHIMAKKKGCFIQKHIDFQQLLRHPAQIDSVKVYDSFDQLLNTLKT